MNRIMPHTFVLIVTEGKLSFLYKSQNHYKRSTVQGTAQNQKSDILIFTELQENFCNHFVPVKSYRPS